MPGGTLQAAVCTQLLLTAHFFSLHCSGFLQQSDCNTSDVQEAFISWRNSRVHWHPIATCTNVFSMPLLCRQWSSLPQQQPLEVAWALSLPIPPGACELVSVLGRCMETCSWLPLGAAALAALRDLGQHGVTVSPWPLSFGSAVSCL